MAQTKKYFLEYNFYAQKTLKYGNRMEMKLVQKLLIVGLFCSVLPVLVPAQILRDTFVRTSAEDWRVHPWKEYKSIEGKFQVLTPGDFDKAVDSVYTDIGKLAYHILIYNNTQKNAENLFYMITFCDYPPGTIHSDSTELLKDFFDASIDQAIKSVNGELAYQNDITLKGFPGKLWRINYLRGEALIKTRAFMVGNRFYTIQTVTVKDMAINAASDRFFDSFIVL